MVKNFDEAHDEFNITYEIAVVGIDEAPQALETDADTAADTAVEAAPEASVCFSATASPTPVFPVCRFASAADVAASR